MTTANTNPIEVLDQSNRLKLHYYLRLSVSVLWVVAAFTLGMMSNTAALVLVVAYPAWDALANWLDAKGSGGLAKNPSQSLNVIMSVVTTLAVVVASTRSMNAILSVFGVWAIISGALQLATGVRRWRVFGAQWAMILSGAQSALAGGFFIYMASTFSSVSIGNIAPYAAFGAFYFGISAISLTFLCAKMKRTLKPRAA